MVRMMSLLLTFFVFFMTAAMTLADDTTPPSRSPASPVKSPASNLIKTQGDEKNLELKPEVKTEEPSRPSTAVSDNNLEDKSKEMLEEVKNPTTVMRLSWKLVPYAVKYKVTFDDEEYMTYINGIEIAVNNVSKIFKVTALDFDNNIIEDEQDFDYDFSYYIVRHIIYFK